MAAVERVCCVWADAVSICVRPAALRRNCSLWKAHLSDPPCRVAQVKVVVKYQGPQPYRSPAPEPWEGCHVESDARLTLGDILLAASKSGKLDCCKFDDGHLWKDLGSELKEMIDDAAEPSGWMGIEEVEDVTLYIQLMRDGNDRPLVVKVPEAREIVGQPIVDAITGGDVNASAEAAQKAFQAVLDAEKK